MAAPTDGREAEWSHAGGDLTVADEVETGAPADDGISVQVEILKRAMDPRCLPRTGRSRAGNQWRIR